MDKVALRLSREFPRNLLDVISSRKNVCNYIDMAIQHCNEEMLRK